MKNPNSPEAAGHGPEFKGVVKKITGKLTGDVDLERKGREEMHEQGPTKPGAQTKSRKRSSPDPHRRG